MRASTPDFLLETPLWRKDFIVIGVDEVGRGALAGPIVTAAFAFAPQILSKKRFVFGGENEIKINDSKKLSSKQREQSARWLIQNCLGYTTGLVDVKTINKIGIAKANINAMQQAVVLLINKLRVKVKFFLLSDYFPVPSLNKFGVIGQENIIKGDEKSFSIAAASIIAKVYRDDLMQHLSTKYFQYGWERNKGYGTLEHRKAIQNHGITKYHRISFVSQYI